jgi:deoxyribonuclease-4
VLIGAHVSPAGGPAKAIERGETLGARAIQILNQNPRAWKPPIYNDEQVEEFRAAMADSDVDALLIHAVYLLNAASEDSEIREKTLTSLIASLSAGEALGATAVVLHPGSAKGGDVGQAIERAGATIAEALAETEGCALHLENTAGAGGTLGRSFDELGALIEAAGGDERLGICLDSCHMLASGIEIRSAESLTAAIDSCVAAVGDGRIGSLHCNDSMMEFGSNRDRHADLGEGELGEAGCAVFLSEPRFADLPCVLETPGPEKKGPTREQLAEAFALRERGLAARG